MTLYFIGLGLYDKKDISFRGLEIVKECDYLYLDSYTSLLNSSKEELEELYKKEITLADRNLVEQQAEEILEQAKRQDVGFLVAGDPFGATTHIDLRLRAHKAGIRTEIIHNASILNAVGEIGLELYKYGKVTSIPFDNEKIDTPVEVFRLNQKNKMHTLFLLDLEPSRDRFMTIHEAVEHLLSKGLQPKQRCIACAGLGSHVPEIRVGSAQQLLQVTFTKKPCCLIIPAEPLHFVEEEALEIWK
jgi:diphthine synthase